MTEYWGVVWVAGWVGSCVLRFGLYAFSDVFLVQILIKEIPIQRYLFVVKSKNPLLLYVFANKYNAYYVLLKFSVGIHYEKLLLNRIAAFFLHLWQSVHGFEVLRVENVEGLVLDDEQSWVVEQSAFALLVDCNIIYSATSQWASLRYYILSQSFLFELKAILHIIKSMMPTKRKHQYSSSKSILKCSKLVGLTNKISIYYIKYIS